MDIDREIARVEIKKASEKMVTNFKKLEEKVKYNDYVMPFGKYAGCFLMDIKSEDPNYFKWLNTLDKEEGQEEFFEALKYANGED